MSWDDFGADCTHKRRHAKCGVTSLLGTLDKDARGAVERALANPELGHAAIYQALKKRVGDKTPNPYTIARHRRGDCQCDEVDGDDE